MRTLVLLAVVSCTSATQPSATPEVTIEPSGDAATDEREAEERTEPNPGRPYWVSHASHEAEDSARAKASPADKATARQMFTFGIQHYEKGDYVAALELFIQAYALIPMPAVAWNIANCLERMGKREDAIDAYHWFATAPETAKNPERAEEAQKRLEALKTSRN